MEKDANVGAAGTPHEPDEHEQGQGAGERLGVQLAHRAENALAAALTERGCYAQRLPLLDERFKIDLLVDPPDRYEGNDRRFEVQVTLALDARQKMREYLQHPGFSKSGERLYVEIWNFRVIPTAAAMIARMFRRPAMPAPRLLRAGPRGTNASLLSTRLQELDALCQLSHKQRLVGRIQRLVDNKVEVVTETGDVYRIPLRLVQDEKRYQLRTLVGAGEQPVPGQDLLSFLPGTPDETGIPVYLAIPVDPTDPADPTEDDA